MKQNNRNNNKFMKKPKNVLKSIPLKFTGLDIKGSPYDIESCKKLIRELQDAGVFTKLSVSAIVKKSLISNETGASSFSIARIQSIDVDSQEVSLMVFSKNTEYADKLDGLVLVPRVRTGRDTEEVSTIFGFDVEEDNE